VDVAAEADDVAEAQLGQEGEQLVVAEAVIGEEGDLAPRRENLGEPHQAGILVVVALIREFVLPHRQPQQWRGAALAGDQMQGEGGLPVTVELGPVHGDQDRLARADHVRHPMGEAVPHIDALVAEQPVHLLDRVLGHQPARLRQRLTDHRHRQGRAGHHAQRRPAQRLDPLGVQAMLEQPLDKPAHLRQPSASRPLHALHHHASRATFPSLVANSAARRRI
jgi:hypothetical protein